MTRPRRSLIMAGGGLKVAFQAGVLQVWLDEAGIEFDHADGASGGTFNLAMYCQGMSGTEIADNWRGLPILKGISPNWLQYFKLIFAASLLKYDRWRKNIYTHWGLDFEKIRSSEIDATFNVYNFTDHRLEVRTAAQMSEDALTAGVSLPIWFPPVRMNGKDYIDAVYMTDANLIEAARRGVDEIWVVWTVSERSIWRNGFISNYFQIIETAGNGRFRADVQRIEASNAALALGQPAEFDKPIEIKVLRAEVPLHYLLNFSSKKFTRAVEMGVDEGRRWCEREGIASNNVAPSASDSTVSLSFTEQMKGRVSPGAVDFEAGARPESGASALSVTLTVEADDVDRFVDDPDHDARLRGDLTSDLYGGTRTVESGTFNLFVDTASNEKQMRYQIWFRDEKDGPWTLYGFKLVHDDPGFDVWQDTTTLFTRIYAGHHALGELATTSPHSTGIIRIHLTDFLKQLTTFKTAGPDLRTRTAGLMKFGKFFLGSLWQVFGENLLGRSK